MRRAQPRGRDRRAVAGPPNAMAPSARERLLHINQAIEKIAQYTDGKDFTDYMSDAMLRDAVERNLTIIAEATLSLDEMQEASVAQEVSQYKRIIGFRIPLTHRYYELDDEVVWQIVLHGLPILRAETQALLNSPERSGAD